jgi:tRNA/rRNA methyltransferase
MLEAEQDRLVIVLVHARNPSNIGAVARAMHDLGYRHLRVVNEYPVPFQAAKSAVDASSVLERAGEFTNVADAIADCTLVLGTTAVGDRALEHPLHTLAEAVPVVQGTLAASSEARVALLFGSEKTGLSNDELSHCHALLTIPMNQRSDVPGHLSLNLGQAAAVCLYTLAQGQSRPAPPISDPPADAGALERLTHLLAEVFESTGYTRRHPANAREANIRRLVRRMGLSAEDAPVWTGFLRQVLHAVNATPRAPDSAR